MDYVKVKDHSDLARDPRTNQIINTNTGDYNQYVARRNAKRKEKNQVLSV